MGASDEEAALCVESFVSPDKAWHQELTFDAPLALKVIVEILSGGPIFEYYVDHNDFTPLQRGEVTEEILQRVAEQQLFEGLTESFEATRQFPAGKAYLCVELDCQADADAPRAEFRLSLFPVE